MCTCFTAPKKGQPNGILAVMSMVIVMSKHIVRVISGLFVKIPMWVGIGAAKEAGGNQALFYCDCDSGKAITLTVPGSRATGTTSAVRHHGVMSCQGI